MMTTMIFSSFHCRQGKRPPPEKGKGKKKGKDGNEADSESEEGKNNETNLNNVKLKLFKYIKGSLLAIKKTTYSSILVFFTNIFMS